MLDRLANADMLEAARFFFVANCAIFLWSVLLCWLIGWAFGSKRIFDRWEPLRGVEVAAALTSVVINSLVSVVGWQLWRAGYIVVNQAEAGRATVDCLAMILGMDLGMYFFHRVAHGRWVYPLLHRFHHRHEATNPISLFVLHPFEVIGFGGLMIAFLIVYPMSYLGLLAYLTLNILFGTIGHSGVEPFPKWWDRVPVLRLVGTSTFHAGHHERPHYNYGFYTLLWDTLFGTLDPEYAERFKRARP